MFDRKITNEKGMQKDGKKKRNNCRSKPEEKGIYTF